MKVSLVKDSRSSCFPVISIDDKSWFRVDDLISDPALTGVMEVLTFEKANPGVLFEKLSSKRDSAAAVDLSLVDRVLPFQPLSYRDFMLYEKHCVDAGRGFAKKYFPRLARVINIYEKITGKTFPKLKPKKRWYEYPIYYLGNHLTFVTNGDSIKIPSYTKELDYELELGAVICAPLKNASPEEAEKAIGGFVVFNDFSARDIQLDEMTSGFGPMKSKNFANSISNVVVCADEILPVIDKLRASLSINGEKIVENDTSGARYSLPEAIAYASWEEGLQPGEFFATGTIPGCSGMENGRLLNSGDSIRLELNGVGVLENRVI